MAQAQSEIRYLTPMSVDVKKKNIAVSNASASTSSTTRTRNSSKNSSTSRAKSSPRRITGTSLKFQRRVAQAVKRARHLALLPYVADLMK